MKKAFKKILAMGLATLLGIGTMNMMMVSADNTALNTELLVNGDFSLKDEDGAVVGWSLTKPSGSGGSIKVENEVLRINASHGNVADGNLDTTKSLYAINRWDYAKPTKGTTVISGRIHVESMQEGSSVVIDSNRKGFGATNTMGATITITKATGGWENFESTITDTTASADGYMFYVRVYGTALVWVDDVSIQHKDRLLPTPWESMSWAFDSTEGTSDNFKEVTNEELTAANANFTAHSGDSCFIIQKTDGKTSRPMYKFGTANAPIEGQAYRISCWYRPIELTDTTSVGPKITIANAKENGKNWYPKSLATVATFDNLSWNVGQVGEDGWRQLSAYFVMNYTSTEHIYARLVVWNSIFGYIDDLKIEADFEEQAKILNSDFKEITSAKAGDTIKVRAHAIAEKTTAEGGEKPAVVLIRYTEENGVRVCTDIKMVTEEIAADKDYSVGEGTAARTWKQSGEDIVFDYTIPNDAAGSVIKAFAWDGVSSLNPIGKNRVITVSAASEN